MLNILALVLAAILIVHGVQTYKILTDKAAAEVAETDKLQRWKATYKALATSQVKWAHDYQPVGGGGHQIVDLLKLVDFARYGVETDVDNLMVSKTNPVMVGDTSIGLERVCLKTTVADGGTLFLRAPNYQALLTGLKRISEERPDIEIGSAALFGNGAFPLVKIGEFCILLRQQ
jgi:hypothetical protein